MSSTNAAFARTTLLMLAVGATILVGIILSSIWLVDRTQDTFRIILQERDIRRTSADLLQNLVDAETGQRGYLIAMDDNFLDPYQNALKSLRANQVVLEELVKDRPERHARIPDLRRLIDQKLEELALTVDLTHQNKRREAADILRGNSGRIYMEGIREILDSFKTQSDEKLQQGATEQNLASQQLRWFTIGGAIAIVLVLGGAILVIMQHVRDLSVARQELQALNAALEGRVQERTEDLMRANQEIQRYAYIVTHDLRAPLVNVMGFTAELETAAKSLQAYVLAEGNSLTSDQIQQARLAAAEDMPEAISFIRSSTRKMDGLINAILKISRDGRRQLKAERIELKPLLEATSASIQHQISEGDGEVQLDIRVQSIVSDRFSLDQILGNLFDNAVKYKDRNRALKLSVRAMAEGRNHVRIEVEDNGRGISKDDHERVFELFRRSGQQDQVGEGIGLAHVRSLARNLGGDISVRSELGQGSTFILRLPVDLSRIVRSES